MNNLRDGELLSPWQIPVKTKSIALVVGAGMKGVTTASLLQQAGKKTVAAEAQEAIERVS